MAGFNGSGQFIRLYNWVNDANAAINITASRMDGDSDGFATGLSTCICKDGQQTTTARIPFAVGASFNQGSAGTPSITIIGDTDTGFYQASAGKLRFTSNGVYSGVQLSSAGMAGPVAATTLTVDTSIAVNTNKFTVNSSGNTVVAGTLGVTGAGTFSSTLAATGNFAINTNKFNVTASSGNTSTAGTLGATGAIIPSQTAGITGTTTNNSVNAGGVGEEITSTLVMGSAISLSTGTAANVTSISLTAGDWDVSGSAIFNGNAATTVTYIQASISSTSATLDTTPGRIGGMGFITTTTLYASNSINTVALPPYRISLSGTTTIYLVVQSAFATNTANAYGILRARRKR